MGLQTALAANGIVSRTEDQSTVRLRPAHTEPDHTPLTFEPLEAAARGFLDFLQGQSIPTPVAIDSWFAGFSGRRDHAQLLRDLYHFDPAAAERFVMAMTTMPAAGAEFLGFKLLAEIGRGAFTRVFLARQGDLANRHVVLKVAADIWGEAETLAQLHHPHIVPIYSVHKSGPFQAVCMPFHGSTTLQDLICDLHARRDLPTSGLAILRLNQRSLSNGSDSAIDAAAQVLGRMSYVEAIVRLGSRLADGLEHAHQHGIIHRDLKPANILVTDDGEPLLIDFNVAADTKQPVGASFAVVAGTLPYMAPEDLAAVKDPSHPLDCRCDIYSFGIVLHELLTGLHPFVLREPSSPEMLNRMLEERLHTPIQVRRWNRAVTPALEAIVRRCLAYEPERRYASARELHEDLECHREHRPLRHVVEPSRRERLAEWSRRHPGLTVAGATGICMLTILVALGAWLWQREQELARRSVEQQHMFRRQEEGQQAAAAWRQFRDDFKTVQFQLYTRTHEFDQLDRGLALGDHLLAQYGVVDDPDWRQTQLVQALPEVDQRQLDDSLAELLVLMARGIMVRCQDEADSEAKRTRLAKAALLNKSAAECSTTAAASPALWRQRGDLAALLDHKEQASAHRAHAATLPLRTAQDYYWMGSDHVAAGKLRDALPLLQKAVQLEPSNYWAWFVLGNGYERLGLENKAEGAFDACIALAPEFVWGHFNRGLTRLRQQEYRLAIADFDEVLQKESTHAAAFLNRGLCRQGLKELAEAEADLSAALACEDAASRLYFLRARVREQRGDQTGAKADLDIGLRKTPADEASWLSRGFALLKNAPQAALADFEEALRLNPRSASALQNKAHVLAEKLGNPKAALAALDKAVALYPESALALSGRGVLHARLGSRAAAHRDAEDTLRRDASPPRLYQVACIFALTAVQHADDSFRAFQLLASALSRGYGLQHVDTDPDLKALRGQPEFRRIVEAARALQAIPGKVVVGKRS